MSVNESKARSAYQWEKWRRSGAVGKMPETISDMDPAYSLIHPAPIDKLSNLHAYLPDQEEAIYKFGLFLAERLRDKSTTQNEPAHGIELYPAGFVMGASLAIHDIRRGVDGFTGKPITGGLEHLPDIIYPLLPMYIPIIADAVYPKDYAEAVRSFMARVNKSVADKKTEARAKTDSVPADYNAVLPGRDPFKMLRGGEEIPSSGILVEANTWKGSNGVFNVYRYANMQYRNTGSSIYVNFEHESGSNHLEFGYEHPNYTGREKQPFNRGDPSTYIPLGWDELDTVDLTTGGRLLVAKKAWPIGSLSTSFNNDWGRSEDSPRRDVLVYFDSTDIEGALSAVGQIAEKVIGLPSTDAENIVVNVRTRLFPETVLQEPSNKIH